MSIRENIIKDISEMLGISYENTESMLSEYESSSLTSEMDIDNFERLICMIIDDNNTKRVLMNSNMALTLLNNYAGHTYSTLSRSFSLRTIIENIVPFLVVNNVFKVFVVEGMRPRYDEEPQKYYLVADSDVTKDNLSEHLKKIKWAVVSIEEIN